jgi:hypothetical protein
MNPYFKIFYIFILFITINVKGQSNYIYEYPIRLKPQNSDYKVKTIKKEIEGYAELNISIKDKQGEYLPFAYCWIKNNSNFDTTFYTNIDTKSTILLLKPDTYSIRISLTFYNNLSCDTINLKPNTETKYNAILGETYAIDYRVIRSKRILKESEIERIIDDLSIHRRNKLIRNKTCYVSWEM